MTTRPLLGDRPLAPARASPELLASLRDRRPTYSSNPTPPVTRLATSAPDLEAFEPLAQRFRVRANAVFATANPTVWRGRLDDGQRDKLWRAAIAVEKKTRGKGRADGAIRRSGLAVMRTLLWYQSLSKDGRCDPSLETLANKCMLCVRTVSQAIDRLAACGLVTVTRRWVRVAHQGVVVARQITNAYQFQTTAVRVWIPAPLPPITRSVTAATRRSMRNGLASFKTFFNKHAARPPGPHTPPNWYELPAAAFDGTASTEIKT